MLPDGNGRELADVLTEASPGVPVLFISGYPDDVVAEFGLQGPASKFLQKPFTPTELRDVVAELLAAAD